MKMHCNVLARKNVKLAKERWLLELGKPHLDTLRSLTETYGFAVALDSCSFSKAGGMSHTWSPSASSTQSLPCHSGPSGP